MICIDSLARAYYFKQNNIDAYDVCLQCSAVLHSVNEVDVYLIRAYDSIYPARLLYCSQYTLFVTALVQ